MIYIETFGEKTKGINAVHLVNKGATLTGLPERLKTRRLYVTEIPEYAAGAVIGYIYGAG